jgi:hypothetical protein
LNSKGPVRTGASVAASPQGGERKVERERAREKGRERKGSSKSARAREREREERMGQWGIKEKKKRGGGRRPLGPPSQKE